MICGAPWAEAALRALDPQVQLTWLVPEGQRCAPDQVVLQIEGQARALLSADAHGAELFAAALGRGHQDGHLRGGGARYARGDRRYAQNHSRPARGAKVRRGRGRRREPPHRPVRRGAD